VLQDLRTSGRNFSARPAKAGNRAGQLVPEDSGKNNGKGQVATRLLSVQA